MADVRTLRGVRYRGEVATDLGRLVAPPYDAAPADGGRALNPFNIGQIEDVNPRADGDPHALAARRYRSWLREGVLGVDPQPALYLHEQTFNHAGERLVRRGLLARVRLARWNERVVLPHERTVPGPRLERLARLRAVQANLSPLYLLYRDPSGELRRLLDAVGNRPADAAGVDPTGDAHRLIVCTDRALADQVGRFFAASGRRLYMADGHHRYEAALAYRDECRAQTRASRTPSLPDAPHEFVLALLADAGDPGVRVLPTHRLIRGLPALDAERIRTTLASLFDLERVPPVAGKGVLNHEEDAVRSPGRPICTLRFAGESDGWRLRAKPGSPHESLMPTMHSPEWRLLDVAVLHTVVIERALGVPVDRLAAHVAFTPDAAVAEAALNRGEAQLAAFLARPSLSDLLAVANAADPLPLKSTYFQPKAPAGLVIHDLAE